MLSFSTSGSFDKTERFLKSMQGQDLMSNLSGLAQQGVSALSAATPVDSGATAASWYYTINRYHDGVTISWHNSHSNGGTNIAVILQYGHGTGTGGWVAGRDYINPAIQPVMDRIASEIERAVKSA